jgi:hypothetical protein
MGLLVVTAAAGGFSAAAASAVDDVVMEQQVALDESLVLEVDADVMVRSGDTRRAVSCRRRRLEDDECCNNAEVVLSLCSQPFMQLMRSQGRKRCVLVSTFEG